MPPGYPAEPLVSCDEPPFADHATENDEPSEDSPDGVAPAEPLSCETNCAPKPELSVPGSSVTADADQLGSEMVPVCPSVVVAPALVNVTVPKSVRGSGVQFYTPWLHEDGASVIHSALETSGLLIWNVFVNEPPVV